MQTIYLDHNATTPPDEAVIEAITDANRHAWANAMSVHRIGQESRQRVELARSELAQLISVRPNEIIFTSGGTESNNLAIAGALSTLGDRPNLITSPVEHSAVREVAQALEKQGQPITWLKSGPLGQVTEQVVRDAIQQALNEQATGILISTMWANNETGVISPMLDIAKTIEEARNQAEVSVRILWHSDATQAVGKIPVDLAEVQCDMMTLSAHKFHGPKGVGGLFVRRGVKLNPQIIGGPQERERRGGTHNTPGIVGLGVASQLAQTFVQDSAKLEQLAKLRDRFEQTILQAIERAHVNGRASEHDALTHRLWNTSNIGFRHLEAEAILMGLSERGIAASAGAACSSGSLEPSPVLLAMGIPEAVAHGSVRFSISRNTTQEELNSAAQQVIAVVRRLEKTLPM